MSQFYDEDKIKAMEAAAASSAGSTPAQPTANSQPLTSTGHFYDEAKIKAMQGGSASSSARTQSLGKIALIALIVITGIGLIAWKLTHNPATMIVNVNKASITELSYLPGIGDAKAKIIIDHRPYTTIEDLKKVPGVGEKTFEKMKPRVKVE